MSDESLDCLKCPAFCCRTAGYVEVSRNDIGRLAKFLGLTVREFEARQTISFSGTATAPILRVAAMTATICGEFGPHQMTFWPGPAPSEASA